MLGRASPGSGLGGVAMHSRGLEYLREHDHEKAEACFRETLKSDPGNAQNRLVLANLYAEQYRPEEALEALGSLDDSVASQIRGKIYSKLNDLDQSIHWFEDSLRQNPRNHLCRVQYSHSLLRAGRYLQGWRENEWRFAAQVYGHEFARGWNFWTGQELKNDSLFIFPESGFGDVIQMLRYIPMVRELGDNVILGCRPPLERLLTTLGVKVSATFVPTTYQAASMSLPFVFRTTVDSIPNRYPYLTTGNSRESRSMADNVFKVGLVWGGTTAKVYTYLNAVRSVE